MAIAEVVFTVGVLLVCGTVVGCFLVDINKQYKQYEESHKDDNDN